ESGKSCYEYLDFYNSYQGGAAGDKSGLVRLKSNSSLVFPTVFTIDGRTNVVYVQQGYSGTLSTGAFTYLDASAHLWDGSLRQTGFFDIRAGTIALESSVDMTADISGNGVTPNSTLWMNGSNTWVDVTCGPTGYTNNTLNVVNVQWDGGTLFSAVQFGSTNKSDVLACSGNVTFGTGTSNVGTVNVTNIYGTANLNWFNVLTYSGTRTRTFNSVSPSSYMKQEIAGAIQ